MINPTFILEYCNKLITKLMPMKYLILTKKKWQIFVLSQAFLWLAGMGVAFSQSQTVRGTVTGEGIPLPGVNILIKVPPAEQ